MADVSKMPCHFVTYSAIQKEDVLAKPAVDCGMECDQCGWNPKIKEARLKQLYLDKRLAAVISNQQKGECKQ